MKKTWLVCLTAILMLTLVLSACSSGNTTANTDTTDSRAEGTGSSFEQPSDTEQSSDVEHPSDTEKPFDTEQSSDVEYPSDTEQSVEPGPITNPTGTLNITIDENGMASWDALPGAVGYEYGLAYDDYILAYSDITEGTQVQLYEGYCLHIRALFSDGSHGDWVTTEIYGDPANREELPSPDQSDNPGEMGSLSITIDENGVASWEAISGAVEYEYGLLYDSITEYSGTVEDTQVQLYEGYSLQIRPVFADGSLGDWTSSETYGDPDRKADISHLFDPNTRNILLDLTVHENGSVSWDSLPDATGYDYVYYYDDNNSYVGYTHDTSLGQFDGYALKVRARFADNTCSRWASTVMYGDPANRKTILNPMFTTTWEDLTSFELISSIRYDTVKTEADGSVTFEATAPNGDTLRFVGSDLTVTEGKIIFTAQSKLTCLDAIGRICAYRGASDNAADINSLGVDIHAAYTFSAEKLHVDFPAELASIPIRGLSGDVTEMLDYQPNYISLRGYSYLEGTSEISELTVFYDDSTYCTPLRDVSLYINFYSAYLEGEHYDSKREVFDLDKGELEFYLIAVPDLPDVVDERPAEELIVSTAKSLYGIEDSVFQVGDLKDADGNVLDKQTHRLRGGETIEVILGDQTFDVELTITPIYKDAQNMNDLVPYAYPEATGTLNTLVIPIVWQDEPEDASDEMLAFYRGELGRVMDESGHVTDYSDNLTDETRFSLSEYYDIASYGKLTVQSFITDWYYAPLNFADVMFQNPDLDFTNAVLDWLYEAYPDMDWSKFDQDANGYFDAVVLINAGDLNADGDYAIISFSGGIMTRYTYTGEYAGTPDRPTFNCYTNVHTALLDDRVLIHEYAHNLGLADYYDVTYSGINALGQYDMQSSNVGDWNPYSKYSVGWIEPEVVQGLESGESVEITIGAMATTGDAIVIPGASSDYFGTPFSEYIMIDLFTDKGVNQYDAEKFGLGGAVGVRIYHVNSLMEYRDLTVEGDSETYPIGTIHVANTYDVTGKGNYLLELIQAGGDNTFTDPSNLRTAVDASDFFYEGDVFTAESYSEFFYNGLMADGTEFGYTVEIVEITAGDEPTATIRITRD